MQMYFNNLLIFGENFSFPKITKLSMEVFLNTQSKSKSPEQELEAKLAKKKNAATYTIFLRESRAVPQPPGCEAGF